MKSAHELAMAVRAFCEATGQKIVSVGREPASIDLGLASKNLVFLDGIEVVTVGLSSHSILMFELTGDAPRAFSETIAQMMFR